MKFLHLDVHISIKLWIISLYNDSRSNRGYGTNMRSSCLPFIQLTTSTWFLYQKSNLYLLLCSTFWCRSQSVVSLDGDKLVHVQKWDGKETRFVREIKDGKMVMVSNGHSPFVPSSFALPVPTPQLFLPPSLL